MRARHTMWARPRLHCIRVWAAGDVGLVSGSAGRLQQQTLGCSCCCCWLFIRTALTRFARASGVRGRRDCIPQSQVSPLVLFFLSHMFGFSLFVSRIPVECVDMFPIVDCRHVQRIPPISASDIHSIYSKRTLKEHCVVTRDGRGVHSSRC